MDFFDSQDRARRKTRWLVAYFALAVLGIIASVYAVAVALNLYAGDHETRKSLWHPELLGIVSGGVILVIGIGSGWKSMQLSGGGGVVARDLGGRSLDLEPQNPEERKLRNVVEEMALASGTPVPEIYLLENEKGINAFAAGQTPANSAIGVTRGCMELLSRDELQGVIAHEFSHILNGDMRLSTRLIGLLHGILLIAIIGEIIFRTTAGGRSRSSREKGGGTAVFVLMGLALFVIGYIGVFFGKLIKSAVSRQREYLADASAVQFTRNPEGIAGALKKIGGVSAGSRLETPNAEEASHMFFANGLRSSFAEMLATHPPLEERIRAIDPQWDGKFVTPEPRATAAPAAKAKTEAGPPPLPRILTGGAAGISLLDQPMMTRRHIDQATRFLAELPEPLRAELHDSSGASAVVYAVLLSSDPDTRARQQEMVRAKAPPAVVSSMEKIAGPVNLAPSRLALVDLAMPALRQLSPDQYRGFLQILKDLVEADQQIDLFEFALQKMVRRHLGVHFEREKPPAIRYRFMEQLSSEAGLLLSALAHLGGGDTQAAFAAGASQLSGGNVALQPLENCGLDRIDAALDRFAAAVPMVKKNLLYACAKTVMADREATTREVELLRAIADALDVPVPPLVQT